MKIEQAAFREMGIRSVIRAINRGGDVTGYHGSTVRTARKRLAVGYVIPTMLAAK